MTMHAGIVLAAGAGTRVGNSRNKVYLPLGGRRIVTWSLELFAGSRDPPAEVWWCATTTESCRQILDRGWTCRSTW
jgi:2-C-methyl-D-erythritol 4-phosphate cytidylyltransferase